MMKVVLVLLIAIVLSVNAAINKCSETECVERGDQCGTIQAGSTYYSHTCESYADTCSNEFSGTNFVSGTCVARVGNNATCKSTTDCLDGFSCVRISIVPEVRQCQIITVYRSPGMACFSGDFCRFTNSDGTDGSELCPASRICKYLSDGAECNSLYSTQCNQFTSSTCKSSTLGSTAVCTASAASALGVKCDPSGFFSIPPLSGCRSPFTCTPDNANLTIGTCSRYFSKEEGTACSSDYHCAKGYCRQPARNTDRYGSCVEFAKTATLNKECINDDYCSAGNRESCECENAETSYCRIAEFDDDFSKKWEKAYACLTQLSVRQKCGDYTVAKARECALKECKSDYCDYQKDRKKAYGASVFGGINNECLVRQVCDASSLFASLSLSFLAVVFVLFF